MLKKISIVILFISLAACGTIVDVVGKTAKVIVDPSIKVGEDADQPTKVSYSINASTKLNINLYSEDEDGSKATPLSFKIIQLKDDSLFKSAGFEALEDDLKGTLKSNYLAHDDYEIEPGKFKFIDFEEVNEKTKFIGVIGAYNDYEKAKWKTFLKIKPRGNEYSISLQFNSKKVSMKKEGMCNCEN